MKVEIEWSDINDQLPVKSTDDWFECTRVLVCCKNYVSVLEGSYSHLAECFVFNNVPVEPIVTHWAIYPSKPF